MKNPNSCELYWISLIITGLTFGKCRLFQWSFSTNSLKYMLQMFFGTIRRSVKIVQNF